MKRSAISFLLFSIAGAGLLLASSEKAKETPDRYKAVTVQTKTARANPAVQLDILVERYTSDSERKEYFQLLKEEGPEA